MIINKRSVVCSSSLLSFSFSSLASLFKKNPKINKLPGNNYRKEEKIVAMALLLAYSVNLSIVFFPKIIADTVKPSSRSGSSQLVG